ncbi:MAG: nucleotidyltransferase substrate binding protein [Hydrogenophaga sp.]|uniref:nucleotidyltransferase substrate binding protein n=1 Tax=Hydrogenophaga sp. TaxID=1904254 RepID=UPI00276672C4|nr:nucleotidyltransferase substrate binding protein [Hydrogenophaga sp.]MDP2416194.1 nucleotidyltransferase substrate binding protein [Hydrogenophaga sp.]MDZ4187435.1 nucleotidyltransferase substrate binding protein [Hydrogenophaga sp.]
MTEDIRWQQRFHNYTKALQTLTEAVELGQQRPLSKLEKQGTIQGFEFTHELGWNVLKDYLESKGYAGLIGSRDATRTAFKNGLIADGEAWMDMIKARNQTSHTYNLEVAERIAQDILQRFYPAFVALENTLHPLQNAQP